MLGVGGVRQTGPSPRSENNSGTKLHRQVWLCTVCTSFNYGVASCREAQTKLCVACLELMEAVQHTNVAKYSLWTLVKRALVKRIACRSFATYIRTLWFENRTQTERRGDCGQGCGLRIGPRQSEEAYICLANLDASVCADGCVCVCTQTDNRCVSFFRDLH